MFSTSLHYIIVRHLSCKLAFVCYEVFDHSDRVWLWFMQVNLHSLICLISQLGKIDLTFRHEQWVLAFKEMALCAMEITGMLGVRLVQ